MRRLVLLLMACGGEVVPAAGAPVEAPDAGVVIVVVDAGTPIPDAGPSFPEAPVHVPAGALCDIPDGWVPDSGAAATFVSCDVETDRFAEPTVPPNAIKVVAWNIEFGKNFAQVKTELTAQNADVLLLSEVPRASLTSSPQHVNAARELARALHLNYAFAVEWDRREKPAELGEHGIAVLSKFPLGNITQIRHTPLNDWWSSEHLYGGRITLGVDLFVGGKTLRAYASHLCTRGLGDTGRAKEAAEARADADLPGRPGWQLYGGDLNTFTCNPAIANCTVAPSAEATVKDFLAAGWIDGTAGWNGFSHLGAGFFPQRLDWLFLRGGTSTPGQAAMTTGSDHKAIFTTLVAP